jgi:hypothetical protein
MARRPPAVVSRGEAVQASPATLGQVMFRERKNGCGKTLRVPSRD